MGKKKLVEKAAEAVVQQVEQPVEQPVVEPVQLSVADLQVLAQIVELASKRGAFQAQELSEVGRYYDKLSKFLAYIASSEKEEPKV